jgi:hypothetical protein
VLIIIFHSNLARVQPDQCQSADFTLVFPAYCTMSPFVIKMQMVIVPIISQRTEACAVIITKPNMNQATFRLISTNDYSFASHFTGQFCDEQWTGMRSAPLANHTSKFFRETNPLIQPSEGQYD